jgi:glucokinase
MGETVGDALANAMTLIDGLVVIGGGLSAASALFLPRLVAELNGTIETLDGHSIPRMEIKAFDLEDSAGMAAFVRGDVREITVPGTSRKILYDPLKRIGVGVSRLGTSRAVSIGAYAFALHSLESCK